MSFLAFGLMEDSCLFIYYKRIYLRNQDVWSITELDNEWPSRNRHSPRWLTSVSAPSNSTVTNFLVQLSFYLYFFFWEFLFTHSQVCFFNPKSQTIKTNILLCFGESSLPLACEGSVAGRGENRAKDVSET